MNKTSTREPVDALVLHADDGVATALRPLAAGALARVGTPAGPVEVKVGEDIRRCHKFALASIPSGSTIRKYGEIIGDATRDIAAGTHVHVHNLSGRAGKR
ncbi:MAG: UxaA family hydrolase [Rhodospirillales bacterium]|jgi:altronate dehydratase small subunit|nr:UxaA family hydrolase [Rhodospirillales bacterium]